MKPLKPSAFLALLLAFALSGAQAGPWQVYKPQGSVFSVKVPGTPHARTQNFTDPKAGNVEMTIYVLINGKTFYLFEDAKAQNAPTDAEVPGILSDVQKGFLGTSHTTLISAQPTKFKGYQARTMLFQKGTMRVKGLTMMVGHHNLSFFATADQAKMNTAIVKNFFDSIKINGK